MKDNELITVVRESVADVHSATPIAQIISRGRAVRAKRRTPALAGAAAMLAGTALAVTTLVPSGHPGVEGSRHPANSLANARLAAWTVAKQANGDIHLTINELQNPVGLQSTLRADGLPVNVIFAQSGQSWTPPCEVYPTSGDVFNAVVHFLAPDSTAGGTDYLAINPSALPAGAGLAILAGTSTFVTGNKIAASGVHLRPGTRPGPDVGATIIRGGPSLPPSMRPGDVGPQSVMTINKSDDGHLSAVVGVTVAPVYASQQCTG